MYGVRIIAEDPDFVYYYQGSNKEGRYGMMNRTYITSILPNTEKKMDAQDIEKVDKDFFCGKSVKIDLAKREGFLRGLLDFRDDAYRNVVIRAFEADTLHLQFGGTLRFRDITKIEEPEKS